ncbi:MAG: hypothetical protein EOO90_05570 [Pedobacter sp.]|nr:MAG: hypothetical protein EOO90_05570 [Pedobacter sp.]
MRKHPFSFLCLLAVVAMFYACKKEPVDSQEFVKNHFLGGWPLKKEISITRENGIIIKNDTLEFGLDSPNVVLPLDTVQFTAEGLSIRNKGKDTVSYTIDATGDNITYSLASMGTWNIKTFQWRNIVLTQEKREVSGSNVIIYYKEEQFVRLR